MGRNVSHSSVLATLQMEWMYETAQGRRWQARVLEDEGRDTESAHSLPTDNHQDAILQQHVTAGQSTTDTSQTNAGDQEGRSIEDHNPTTR